MDTQPSMPKVFMPGTMHHTQNQLFCETSEIIKCKKFLFYSAKILIVEDFEKDGSASKHSQTFITLLFMGMVVYSIGKLHLVFIGHDITINTGYTYKPIRIGPSGIQTHDLSIMKRTRCQLCHRGSVGSNVVIC